MTSYLLGHISYGQKLRIQPESNIAVNAKTEYQTILDAFAKMLKLVFEIKILNMIAFMRQSASWTHPDKEIQC